MPYFRFGAFSFGLNIDPIAIAKYKENKNVLDWVSYSLGFINNIRFRSINEVFSLQVNKTDRLDGDLLGLYGGHDHEWDQDNVPLTFSNTLNLDYFGYNLYGQDITFGRFAISDRGSNIAGVDISLKTGAFLPLEITAGALVSLENKDLKLNSIYPEVSLYIPFLNKGFNSAGLRIGASTMITPTGGFNINDNGFLIGVYIPVQFDDFKAKIGTIYSTPNVGADGKLNLHYLKFNSFGYNPKPVGNTSLITIALEASYEAEFLDIDLKIASDIAVSTMNFVSENSILDFSIAGKIYNVGLSAGLAIQNFTDINKFADDAKFYAGLSFDTGAITSTLKGGVNSISKKDFYLSYEGSVTFLDQEKKPSRKSIENSFPIYFDLHTGYIHSFNDKASTFLIEPIVMFGRNNLEISLRAPILLTTTDSGELVIAGINGRKWWDFGYSDTGYKKLYRIYSDSISIINSLHLGNPETSYAYLNIERDRLMNDTLFSAFGSEKTSSLSAGFNFYNLDLNLYADNLETPHIAKLGMNIYPTNKDGVAIALNVASEFYIKDFKNFDLFLYPEIGFDIPIFTKHFRIAAFASGAISVNYKDGVAENLRIIYDFNNKDFYSAMAGIDIYTEFDFFSMHLMGGIRKGNLAPDMYNAFTSLYNTKPSLDDEYTGLTYFVKFDSKLELKPLDITLTYSVKDVEKLIKENIKYKDDLISAGIRLHITESITLTGNLHRRGFVSLFSGTTSLADVFLSTDSIYSLGLEIDLGKVSIAGKYSTLPIQSAFTEETDYLNINNGYNTESGIATAFALTTRISF